MSSGAVFTAMKIIALCLVAAAVAGTGSASAQQPKSSMAFVARQPDPRAAVVHIVQTWRRDLVTAAHVDPHRRFHNLARATLLARLRSAAKRYHFDVIKVEFLRPRQAAPLVVVETDDKQSLVAATPAILRSIDPKARTNDDRTGWAYEGFLFEALGSGGTPFLVVFNDWRGPHAGGGQWAASASLYPFAHG